MRQLTLIVALLLCSIVNAQINWDNWRLKSPTKEYMFLETHWDYAKIEPGNDLNEDKDIHYAVEFGMRSNLGCRTFGVEAKVAFEEFPNLYGGYRSYGGGFGPYWVAGGEEQIMYYAGIRIVPWVFRTNPTSRLLERRENLGLELKWTYTFDDTFYIGVRLTWDTANDMEIIDRDLTEESRWAGNFTIGWNIKK